MSQSMPPEVPIPVEPELPQVDLVNGGSLTPQGIKWLWKGFLAVGKIHLDAGIAGSAKTTKALAIAATITAGGRWPDGTQAELGSVLIWSGEDDYQDTLLPRLIAMGADPCKVFFVKNVREDGETRPFNPSSDMTSLIHEALKIKDIRLVIIDPIVSAITGDSHKNAEVRRALQPIVDFASATGAAVLGISHFSKGTIGREPLERVTGSIAFGALPRIVFVTGKDAESGDRLFIRAKSNLGPDGGGFKFDLLQREVPGYPDIEASVIAWGEPIDGTARDLLGEAESDVDERCERTEAEQFLRDLLSDGELPAKEVQAAAGRAGLAWRTVQRAKDNAGVISTRHGFGKDAKYIWSLKNIHGCHESHHKIQGTQGAHGTHDKPSDATDQYRRASQGD